VFDKTISNEKGSGGLVESVWNSGNSLVGSSLVKQGIRWNMLSP
jgi:hypothetical protein